VESGVAVGSTIVGRVLIVDVDGEGLGELVDEASVEEVDEDAGASGDDEEGGDEVGAGGIDGAPVALVIAVS
jgi:hypothetical protein